MTSISEKALAITAREKERYANMTPGSQKATERAKKVLPLGVASNFQYFEPHPIVADHASGSRLWDVDGNEFIDYNGGYGSLFAGHAHPILVEAITAQAPKGTLFTTPSVLIAEVAEALVDRFPFEMVRFTNSGTEATMDALRLARAYTGRDKIIKLEGCYHGHHDLVMMSVRPPLEKAGPADRPNTVPYYSGTGKATKDEVVIIPFNDLPALERAFTEHPGEISAFILEPVPENMGIVLPDDGYLAAAKEICHKYGALIVFDEVKTGITSNWGGASAIYSIQPDLICLAKSIGGGVPIAAFGGSREIMGYISDFTVAHQGTFNGNPLVTAASLAVLTKICTKEATEAAIARNARLIEGCQRVIDETGLPAHTVKLGAKGCVTYVPERVRTFRDYKKTDFDLAYAHWIYMMTHGIFLPPGLDEQWLVSVAHSDADIDTHLEIFEAFVREVTA